MSSSLGGRLLTAGFDAVLRHLSRDGVSVDAQQLGGVTDAAFGALQRSRDEGLLELAARVFVTHAALQHLLYEAVELLAHGRYVRSRPERSR